MGEINSSIKLSSIKHDLKKQQRQLIFKRIISNKLIITGGWITFFLFLITMLGPILSTYDPYEMIVTEKLQGPSTEHLLGTDNLGRDLLSRIVYGAQVSMGVGFSVTILSSIFGLIIGLYASYYRFLDQLFMRICDGLMAIPSILLAIALMAALGPMIQNVVIALSIVYTPFIARAVRSVALVVREETYIEAMHAQGASQRRIIWNHIMPNTFSPLIVQATFIFAEAILTEAALSFLGAGVPAPNPSWGNILYDGKLVIFNGWWMTVFPGIMIALSVLGLNLLGDGLRDLLDPHARKSKK
ncbi:ABC transporter permease [Robertmurraya massiliosenegalensis]|uniref:ABC transporter permease n=1 Tax=Robertmurraya massiliosenegalensis TaxID=1287657 RepID=UPI00030FB60A|nr:ABC transporter permease [Robertmurraya massiliosenegalensis]